MKDTMPPKIGFYCTMLRGERVAWLAGPFDTKQAAEARLRDAREAAEAADPWSAFDAFGVTRLERPVAALPYGVLNERLGLPFEGAV